MAGYSACFGTDASEAGEKNRHKGIIERGVEKILQTAQQKVSVIVPVYNAEKYLRQALDSILKQDYPELEIILVENMSEDSSMKICQSYEKAHKEIRLFREKKRGLGDARNTGLKRATGKYICFVDADDYLPDEKIIAKFINIAEQTASDVVICNYARLWNEKLLPAAEHRAFSELNPDTEDFRFKGFFSVGHLSYVWAKLYRKSFLDEHGLRFSSLEYAEDKLFNIQCYMSGAVYTYIEDRGYIYRKNDQSVSWQYRSDSAENWFRMAYELRGWLEQKNKNTEEYASLIRYLILFAAFFDGKMEYMQHRKSLWAVRKVLRKYGSNPIGKKVFTELSDRTRNLQLKQNLWKIMIRTFSTGMKKQWYILMAVGIRMLISHRVDERLSDTGMRG